MIEFVCEECGNKFSRIKSYVKRKELLGYKVRYCSIKCHLLAIGMKDPVETTCMYCDKNIVKSYPDMMKGKYHFCSKSCSTSFHNKINPKRKAEIRLCKKCGKEVKGKNPKSKLCMDCGKELTEKFKNFTFGEYKSHVRITVKGYCRISDRVRYLNRSWNKNLLSLSCQYCGYGTHIDLCHKKPISKFSDDSKLSDINSLSNNIVLCPNHHWEYDHGILDIANIPDRKDGAATGT